MLRQTQFSTFIRLLAVCILGCAFTSSPGVSAQSADCPNVHAATPTEHLNRAIRDPSYGACFSGFAKQQKAVCDAQSSTGPERRQCLQLATIFQDLGRYFDPQSSYFKSALECAAKGSKASCDTQASEEKRMRCSITPGDCLPPFATLPPGNLQTLDNDVITIKP